MSIIEDTRTVSGAEIGIITLDTHFPRAHGDVGNGRTWPFPVLYKVATGASPHRVIHEKGQGLREIIVQTGLDLVKMGARGIATTGGFLSLFQDDLAAACAVPVASSSLMQIPLVQRLL